ncbi:MAG: hypothetical protein PHE50_06085 [Dehalococcoidales bacterium]|nr:hypothetical protein [Dehalococcoidales bacterium]
METKKDTTNVPKYGLADNTQTIEHRGPPEVVSLNKYHLILILERLKKGKRQPTFSDTWAWLGTFLTLLIVVFENRSTGATDVSSQSQLFLGLSTPTWNGIFCVAMVISGAVLIVYLVKAILSNKELSKTPEQEVDEVCKKLAKDNERLNAIKTSTK